MEVRAVTHLKLPLVQLDLQNKGEVAKISLLLAAEVLQPQA